MAKNKPRLLDSFAILRWTQKEPGWKRIKSLLESAGQKKETLYINQINLYEVYYKTIRLIGLDKAKLFLETFHLLPVNIVHPVDDLIWRSGEIKAEYPMSLADCFAVATAVEYDARIITGDPEFKQVEHFVEIEWI